MAFQQALIEGYVEWRCNHDSLKSINLPRNRLGTLSLVSSLLLVVQKTAVLLGPLEGL
jgi:hypothetical protein